MLNVIFIIIGVILNAVPTVSYLIKDSGLFYLSVDLTVVLFLVLSAVFYFTKVRVLGMPLKLIFGIFAILATFISVGGTPYIIAQSLNDGLGIFADFEGFIYALTQTKAIIFSLIANLLSAFAAVYFYVAVVFFTPKKD